MSRGGFRAVRANRGIGWRTVLRRNARQRRGRADNCRRPRFPRFIEPKLPFEASGKFERSAILVLARYEVIFLFYARRRSTDHALQRLAQATPRTSCEAKAF